jgi:putative ABC transport system permease protein
MMLLKMVAQSLGRHPRRTVLILFAVMISVLTMEIIAGMLHGISDNFFTNILSAGGHGQVRGQGWEDRLDPYSLDTALADTEPILAVLEADPRVTAAEPVLGFGALFLQDGKSLALQVLGVITDTGFFPKVRSGLEQGAFLPDGNSILVSRSLADFLGLEPGSEVMLLTEDSGGSPYYLAFSLDGIFATDSLDFDDTTVLVGLEAARIMTWLPAGATEVRFTLVDRNLAGDVAVGLEPELAAFGASIHDWRYLNAGLLSMVDMMDVFIWVFNLIVIIVAATVITNAILMNVFDRMKEFGTLRAIGLRRGRLFRLIMLEGAVLGSLGSALGLAIGIPLVLYFQHNGLDWGGISEAFGMGSFFNFAFSPARSAADFAAGTLTALAGSFYAASIASRTRVVDALKEA